MGENQDLISEVNEAPKVGNSDSSAEFSRKTENVSSATSGP